jgi:ribulose-5-phosphate 4-epimerase/fuculose-1-phosphate aldolase
MEVASKVAGSLSCSHAEWQARMDLAALYRVFVHFGWTDLTYSHLSARVPGEIDTYLIHPYGALFEEVTASSLIKVDFDGKAVNGGLRYSQVGHLIHTLILRSRPEINYVLHSHTRAGIAVSAMRCGLLPISEHANAVLGTLAYHQYGVIAESRDDCRRLTSDLGNKYLMMLHNHGLLACGRTAGEAFLYHYFLERACEVQADVAHSGQDWIMSPEPAVAELSAWGAPRAEPWGGQQWAALVRMLERKDPSFRT